MLLSRSGSKSVVSFLLINPGRYSRCSGKVFLPSCLAILLLFSTIVDAVAGSQLTVTPTRIVLSGKMRSASVTIINNGDSPGTYRISLVNKRMTVDGRFEEVKEPAPGELFSDKMIRYSPRQVVLDPGKTQVVRFGLRKPSNLEDGEYRSHILFRAIPQSSSKDLEAIVKPSTGLVVSLKAIIGISIPIIVRHGKTSADVSIVSAEFVPRQSQEDWPHISMELERSGNQSVYGDLLAEFIAKDGSRKIISQVNGVAVYTPGNKRNIKLPVVIPPGLELTDGTIQVFYRSQASQGGKVMAQTQIKIP